MKICTKCNLEKDYSCYHKNKWQKDGFSHYCKDCKREAKRKDYAKNRDAYRANQRKYYINNKDEIKKKVDNWRTDNLPAYNARQASYRANKILATPPWADLEAIKSIYVEREVISQKTGKKWHVDHIIPLNGKTVCGLHCEQNLRIITESENASKSNKFTGATS